jgi:hypothetical protein
MQYWPFLLLLLVPPLLRFVSNAQWRQSRGGMSFTGMTVILVAVAMLWVSTGSQRPSGTSAPMQGSVDYQDGDSALRALLD